MGIIKVVFELVVCYMVYDFGFKGICVFVVFFGLIMMCVVFGIVNFSKLFEVDVVKVLFGYMVIIEEVGVLIVFLCILGFFGMIGQMIYVDVGVYIVV